MNILKQPSKKLIRKYLNDEFALYSVSNKYTVFIWLPTHTNLSIFAYVKRDLQDRIFGASNIYKLRDLMDCLVEFREGEQSKVIDTSDFTFID